VPPYSFGYIKIPIKPDCDAEELPSGKTINSIDGIRIFPNPVSDVLNIFSTSIDVTDIEIEDIQGVTVKHIIDSNIKAVDISDVKAGFYTIIINKYAEKSKVHSFIKM
jgi:S-ribosylhomocysteine lyase LuxS involved in autoinducer biosynthesis